MKSVGEDLMQFIIRWDAFFFLCAHNNMEIFTN